MLNPMPDKIEGTYRGGEGTTPVTTAYPGGRWGKNLVRVELESKTDDQKEKRKKKNMRLAFFFTSRTFRLQMEYL